VKCTAESERNQSNQRRRGGVFRGVTFTPRFDDPLLLDLLLLPLLLLADDFFDPPEEEDFLEELLPPLELDFEVCGFEMW